MILMVLVLVLVTDASLLTDSGLGWTFYSNTILIVVLVGHFNHTGTVGLRV
jgi:hypothetical protein